MYLFLTPFLGESALNISRGITHGIRPLALKGSAGLGAALDNCIAGRLAAGGGLAGGGLETLFYAVSGGISA